MTPAWAVEEAPEVRGHVRQPRLSGPVGASPRASSSPSAASASTASRTAAGGVRAHRLGVGDPVPSSPVPRALEDPAAQPAGGRGERRLGTLRAGMPAAAASAGEQDARPPHTGTRR